MEPPPGVVRILPARNRQQSSSISGVLCPTESKFVYRLAASLVSDHGHTWRDAIALSEKCWTSMSSTQKSRTTDALPCEDDDAVSDVDHDVLTEEIEHR